MSKFLYVLWGNKMNLELLDDKKRAFAQSYIKSDSAISAYNDVYGKTNYVIALVKTKKMMKDQTLLSYIDILKKERDLKYRFMLYNNLLHLGKVATILTTSATYLALRQPDLFDLILTTIR